MSTTTITRDSHQSQDTNISFETDESFKRPKNFLLLSIFFTIVMSILLYWAPYFDWAYLWLENLTNDGVIFLLNLTGVYSERTPLTFPIVAFPEYREFGEASELTPGVFIPSVSAEYVTFWIIKACTGMQAGAVLISLIWITPIPQKVRRSNSFKESLMGRSQLLLKLKVTLIFFVILFVGNVIRIWFHLYLVGALGLPFSFAHDDLSKPIGFVGTLFFAWLIEKQGIPIIDTFADWIDGAYNAIVGLFSKKQSSN
jgi:hypothetical protein